MTATTDRPPVADPRDYRVLEPRFRARSAWWLVLLTTLLVVVAAREPDGRLGGEQAATLQIPGGTQQVWCMGQGPGVVLVNGIGDQASSRQWLDVQGELAKGARVCRYDRPGTGDSPASTAPSRGPEALERELDAVVDHTTHGEVVLVDALDPSVGLVRGTGADDLSEVAMADEQLDLYALEKAAGAVTAFPIDIRIVVLVRERDVTPAWIEGQHRLAALSPRSDLDVVEDTDHQIPTDAPRAIADAVRRMLDERLSDTLERVERSRASDDHNGRRLAAGGEALGTRDPYA